MGALFDFKCTCDSTLVWVCQADAKKCIFVWTILSQTPRRTPQVTSDAGRISARIFWLFPKERRMLRKRDYQGRLSFHFFDRWITDLATHRQKKVQAMSWKNLQMLEFCLFAWSWMGPINCAPNPYGMFFYIVLTPISTTSGLWSTGNTRKYQQIDVYIYQCQYHFNI